MSKNKFHFSPKLNRMAECSGVCKYGTDTPHFATKEEGNAWVAEQAAKDNSTFPATTKKKANPELTNLLDQMKAAAAAGDAGEDPEIAAAEVRIKQLREENSALDESLERLELAYERTDESDVEGFADLDRQYDEREAKLTANLTEIVRLDAEISKKENPRKSTKEMTTAEWRMDKERREAEFQGSEHEIDSHVSNAVDNGTLHQNKATFMNPGGGWTTGDQLVGWTAEGRSVYVQMNLRHRDGMLETVEHDNVSGAWEVSVSGLSYRPRAKNADSGGQNIEELKSVTVFPKGVTADDRDAVVNLWVNNHLNSMQAGCAHQEVQYEIGKSYHRLDLDNTEKCKHTGYSLGQSWLTKPASADDVNAGLAAFDKLRTSDGKKPPRSGN